MLYLHVILIQLNERLSYTTQVKIIAVDISSDVPIGVFIRYLTLKQETKIKKKKNEAQLKKYYQGK